MKAEVDKVNDLLAGYGKELKTVNILNKGPLTHGYNTEIDVMDKCDV